MSWNEFCGDGFFNSGEVVLIHHK